VLFENEPSDRIDGRAVRAQDPWLQVYTAGADGVVGGDRPPRLENNYSSTGDRLLKHDALAFVGIGAEEYHHVTVKKVVIAKRVMMKTRVRQPRRRIGGAGSIMVRDVRGADDARK